MDGWEVPTSIAPDGTVLLDKLISGGLNDIMYLPRGEGTETRAYLATPANETSAAISHPTGASSPTRAMRRGARSSTSIRFPSTTRPAACRRSGERVRLACRRPGAVLRRRIDARFLRAKTQPQVEVGKPRLLFELPKEVRGLASAPDGDKFFLLLPVGENPSALTVVQNWASQLEKSGRLAMTLNPGRSLAQYRLAERIGEGGMGEVWRATDTTLGRDVAIKILPAAFAADAERLARFEREAKLLASLNHPNIAGIYGLHEADGVRFLAMELVPGRGSRAAAEEGQRPLFPRRLEHRETDRRGARGRARAGDRSPRSQAGEHQDHGRREGKGPRLRPREGSRRAPRREAPGGDAAMSPTITSLGTVAGVILGTAAYMSPEQARGKSVDKRADIWAFGCVLYEMLTGGRPFEGETISDTLASVLARDPDWNAIPATTPVKVRELLQRCLDKDPKRRMRDIGDARIELEQALADRTASGRVRVAPACTRRRHGGPADAALAVRDLPPRRGARGVRHRQRRRPAGADGRRCRRRAARSRLSIGRPILPVRGEPRRIRDRGSGPASRGAG